MSEDQARQAVLAIAARLQQGESRDDLIKDLTENGMDASEAGNLVDQIQQQLDAAVAKEQITPGSMITAAIGGLVAAVIGGLVWGLLVKVTSYEIGIVAWGIGGLAGLGVIFASGGRRGPALQFLAVASAFLGILLGKFASFMFVMADFAAEEQGATVSALDLDWLAGFNLFIQNISELLGGYDLLWIGFAVVTAWKMLAGMGSLVQQPG